MVCATSYLCLMLFAQVASPPVDLRRPPDWNESEAQEQVPSASSEKIVEIIQTLGVLGGTRQAESMRVKPGRENTWGHGYLFGRPGRIKDVNPTDELLNVTIRQGPRSSRANTEEVDLTTTYKDVNATFTSRDDKTSYVFEYIQPTADANTRQLIATYTPAEFLVQKGFRRIPQVLLSGNEIQLLPASGEVRGRITHVERAGDKEPRCILHLRLATSENQKAADPASSPTALDATSDQGCQHAEALLATNRVVKISYAIQAVPPPSVAPAPMTVPPKTPSGSDGPAMPQFGSFVVKSFELPISEPEASQPAMSEEEMENLKALIKSELKGEMREELRQMLREQGVGPR